MSKKPEKHLKLVEVDDNTEWDLLLRQSSQYSIYLTSNFLKSSGLDKYRYFLYENDSVLLGCLLPPATISDMNALSYCMYQGLFFVEKTKGNYADEINRIQNLSKLTTLLVESKRKVSLSLHHSVNDIRGIEWNLYEKGISSRMKYKLRYSGIIHLRSFVDFTSYTKSIRKVRMQELTLIQKSGLVLDSQPDVSVFMDLYKEMFKARGIKLGDSELNRVLSILTFGLSSGAGRLLMLHETDGKPISGVFILSDETTDYYQFGASNPKKSNVSGASFLLLLAIEESFKNNRKFFDMVGMNSPNRGDFKASFNARVSPYFEIEIIGNDEGN